MGMYVLAPAKIWALGFGGVLPKDQLLQPQKTQDCPPLPNAAFSFIAGVPSVALLWHQLKNLSLKLSHEIQCCF